MAQYIAVTWHVSSTLAEGECPRDDVGYQAQQQAQRQRGGRWSGRPLGGHLLADGFVEAVRLSPQVAPGLRFLATTHEPRCMTGCALAGRLDVPVDLLFDVTEVNNERSGSARIDRTDTDTRASRIVAAEDNGGTQKVLRDVQRDLGHQATIVNSLQEVLALLQSTARQPE